MKTAFSKYVNKKKLYAKELNLMSNSIFVFNFAKIDAYNMLLRTERSGKSQLNESLHLTIKHKYLLNDYFANSAVRSAKGYMDSQNELKKDYLEQCKQKIRSMNAKIKREEKELHKLQSIKKTMIKGKLKFPRGSKKYYVKDDQIVVDCHKTKTIFDNMYLFEHQYLDVQIKQIKTRIGLIKGKLNRFKIKKEQINRSTNGVCFGTKDFFKKQYTVQKYKRNHERWLKEFREKRFNKLAISGRKDAKCGNFSFNYNPDSHELSFTAYNGESVHFGKIEFPYMQEMVDQAVKQQISLKGESKKKFGQPITWSIEDHGNAYLIKVTFEEPKSELFVSKEQGLIGIDLNYDHIAVSDINSIGQLKKVFTIPFDLDGKSSGQISKILEKTAIKIINYCIEANKPLAREDLNTEISKMQSSYRGKKRNRKVSMFAYQKMISSVDARAQKRGIGVFKIDPAYTSQIGKIKYMRRMGISIHESASYTIARRAMGFKESLPPGLATLVPEKKRGCGLRAQWKHLVTPYLKGVKPNYFYSCNFDKMDAFDYLNKEVNLYRLFKHFPDYQFKKLKSLIERDRVWKIV